MAWVAFHMNNKDSDDPTYVTVKPHIALDDQDEDAKPDPDDQDIDSNSDENFENAHDESLDEPAPVIQNEPALR
jgi:hypothetical protein